MLEFEPSFFELKGQLRFASEQSLEAELDDVGLRVNGQDFWEFEDLDEVQYEPFFRSFRIWIPFTVFEEGSRELTMSPVSSRKGALIFFKPPTKEHVYDKRDMAVNSGFNFKVIEGMLVQGRIEPPLPGVQVQIQRDS